MSTDKQEIAYQKIISHPSRVGEVNDSGADLDIFRLLAVYVSLLAPKGQANIGVL